jgi:hypothetical protein
MDLKIHRKSIAWPMGFLFFVISISQMEQIISILHMALSVFQLEGGGMDVCLVGVCRSDGVR